MKISTKFYLSFWMMIMFLILVILIAMFQVHSLYKLTSEFNDYSELTSHLDDSVVVNKNATPDADLNGIIRRKNVVHDAHLNIVKMLNRIKEIALIKGSDDIEAAKKAIFALEANIEKSFETIEKHFTGNKQKLDNVRHLFEQWKSIRNQVIALQIKGRRDEAMYLMFKGEGAEHVAKLEKNIEKLHHFMDEEVDNFLSKARSAALNSLWVSIGMVTVLVFGGWFVFAISAHLSKNVTLALGIANAVASGNLSDHFDCDSQTNTGQFLKTLDTMQTRLIKSSHDVENMATHLQELEKEKRIVEKEKLVAEQEKRIAEKALRTKNALDNVFGSFMEGGNEEGDGGFGYSGEEDLIDYQAQDLDPW